MPPFTSDDLGAVNDKVTLRLNGEELLVAESYDVRMSFFRQPSVFALRTGWGGTTQDLLRRYPPNSPFELHIGGRKQFTGRIYGVNCEQSTGATEVTFHGRDDLAPLHDAYAVKDVSYDNQTYVEMLTSVLTQAGYGDYTLLFDDTANRTARTGVTASGGGRLAFGRPRANRPQKKAGQLKAGEKLYDFYRKQIDRGGLFLLAGIADNDVPTLILTEPVTDTPPMYRILRRRGQLRNQVNVTQASFQNDGAKRYVEYVVHGRATDQKTGQKPVLGSFLDEAMLAAGFPRERVFVIRDDTVSTSEQADNLAWRTRSEHRREGRVLNYSVSGHSVPALTGRTSNDRAAWAVNTIVEVVDEEFGLQENMWITDVQFQRDAGGTRTNLTMVSAEDWVPPT